MRILLAAIAAATLLIGPGRAETIRVGVTEIERAHV